MTTILADHDMEGQVTALWGTLAAEGWLALFPIQVVTFAQVGLSVVRLATARRACDSDRSPMRGYSGACSAACNSMKQSPDAFLKTDLEGYKGPIRQNVVGLRVVKYQEFVAAVYETVEADHES